MVETQRLLVVEWEMAVDSYRVGDDGFSVHTTRAGWGRYVRRHWDNLCKIVPSLDRYSRPLAQKPKLIVVDPESPIALCLAKKQTYRVDSTNKVLICEIRRELTMATVPKKRPSQHHDQGVYS